MTRSPRGLTCLALLLLLLPAASAYGQQGDTNLAKRYYKLGEELYNRADYEEALKQFKRAYTYSGQAALLYNMARCRESLGQHKQAVEHYERFLKEGSPKDPSVIKARIANLRRLIDKKEKPAPPAPKPSPTPPASQPKPTPAPVTPKPKPAPKPTPVPDPPKTASPSRPLRTTGWILVGVGGVSLVAGAVFSGLAAGKASDMEQYNADGREYKEVIGDEEEGQSMQTGQIVALVAGGVVVATGAVLLILDARKQRTERRAWLAPVITPGGALVAGGVQF